MTFNSWVFAAFFAVFFWGYERVRGVAKKWVLLIGSYAFYAAWDVRFLLLIMASTLLDFYVGQRVEQLGQKKGKRFIYLSLLLNIGALAYFKYANFFIGSATALLTRIGLPSDIATLQTILPVGISFYTFQTISYSIDIYRGELKASRSLLDFSCFVAFFPQLVAGPIERAKDLLPRVAYPASPSQMQRDTGWFLILVGLFKKIVIADGCAGFVNFGFNNPEQSMVHPLLVTVFFSFQIYADFSGYTDMARGIARLLGVELSLNFLKPYLVGNPSLFWRHWHISLSSWLRDYLYIPMGGNRKGEGRTLLNLFLTMLLGGLWHGAGWAFILWGGFHGVWLILHRVLQPLLRKVELVMGRAYGGGAIACTYLLTLVGWFIFRVGSVEPSDQLATIREMGSRAMQWSSTNYELALPLCFYGGLVLLGQKFASSYDKLQNLSFRGKVLLYSALILGCFLFACDSKEQFIYFQF